jgi:phosphoglycolate phosphatase
MDKNSKEISLFFDLDGTLWDAVRPITLAWNLTMEQEKMPYRFDETRVRSTMGLTPEETATLLFPEQPLQEGLRLFRACVTGEIAYLSRHPGATYPHEDEVLAALSSLYNLYVVSNSEKGYVENFLSACHKERYFSGHICAGDTGLAKWGNILYLKDRENLGKVIYIGDTAKDKAESERAGVPFIHAAYGFGAIPDCEFAISSLDTLPEEILKVFKKAK